MTIAGIVFDKDGTLYDFNATWGRWAAGLIADLSGGDAGRRAALERALSYDAAHGQFRADSIVIAETAETVAGHIFDLVEHDSKEALLAQMNLLTADVPQIEATPLQPFLAGLRASGLALGVATNDAEAPARANLDGSGVTHLFDFIAGYDSGFGAKPGPGQLLAFADAIGHAPEACAMVGDSTHDLHAAQAAGMIRVGVLTGTASRADLTPYADVVFDTIADLPDWLARNR